MNNKGSIALITILATALLGGLAFLARGEVQQPTNEPTLGKFNDPFIEVQGGTGTSTYVTGDLLYADGANTLGSLPVGSAGQVLKVSGGVPSWGVDNGSSGASSWEVAAPNLLTPTNTSAGIIVRGSSTIDNNLRVSGSLNATSSNIDTLSVNTLIAVPDNSFALGNKTTGNYVATIADDGQSTITINNSGTETAGITLRVVDVVCTGCLGATEIAGLGTGDFSSANVSQWTNDSGYLTGATVAFNGAWHEKLPNMLAPTNTSAGILVRASSTIDSNLRVSGSLNATSTLTDTLNVNGNITITSSGGDIQLQNGEIQTNEYYDAVSDFDNASPAQGFRFFSGSGLAQYFAIEAPTGYVGILDSSPDYFLDIQDALAGNTLFTVGDAGTAGTATSTGAMWVGSGGTANFIDLSGGDLYVQDDAEVDGSLRAGNSTTTNLGVTSLAVASCDVMATTNGDLYCGTNGAGSTGGNGAWESYGSNVLRPTNTSAAILVNAASSTITNLVVSGNLHATTSLIDTLNLTNDLTVANGGTGASSLTDHGVLVGSGTDAVTALSVGTNGQLLIGSTGADPVFGTLNCAGNLTCTTGAGTLQIDVDDSYLFNTGDTGSGSYIFTGDARIATSNATTSNIGTLLVYNKATITSDTWLAGNLVGQKATVTNLGVTSLGVASCDVKATTAGDLYCGTDATGASGSAGAWEAFSANVLRPTNTTAAILVNSASSTITRLNSNGATISDLNATTTQVGTLTVYTGSTFPANDISDAEVSDTLTASDLVAGSAVVADSEVVDALTINTSIEGVFSGGLRATPINASSTNIGTLMVYGGATSTNLAVLGMTAANCDVKATTAGTFYCGTDAGGAGSDMNSWEILFTNALTPTSSSAGIFVKASSTFDSTLRVNSMATTSRMEIVDPTAASVVDTGLTVIGNRVQFGPARYPANYVSSCPNCMYMSLDRASDVDDVSIVFRSQGNARGEIGLIGDSGANNLTFKTATGNYGSESFSSRMVITPAGNIGMGTTSPTHLLSVGTNNDFTVDYVGNVIASTSVTVGNLGGNGVLSVSGLQQSGGGSYLRVRDTVQGTYGYFGQNSVINGGTAYSQLSIQNPQASGTMCLSAGARASATAGTNCDMLFNSASSDIWFSGNARIPTLNSTTTNIDNLVINTTAIMPNGTSPTVSGTGKFALDTTSNQFLVATSSDAGGSPTVFGRAVSRLFGINVASSTAIVAGNTFDMGVDYDGFTVIRIMCHTKNGTSLVVNLTDGDANDTNTKTCSPTTNGDWATTTTNNVWLPGEKVLLEAGTNTGSVEGVMVTLFGFITRK